MKLKYIFVLMMMFIGLTACDDVLEDVHFNVTLDGSNVYTAGSDITFNIEGNPNWITFYSGEEGFVYPSGGVASKNISNALPTYTYKFTKPGTYVVTFVAGNTNYEGEKTVVKEVTFTIE